MENSRAGKGVQEQAPRRQRLRARQYELGPSTPSLSASCRVYLIETTFSASGGWK